MPGGTLFVYGAFASPALTAALLRTIGSSRAWRYFGRDGALAEYVHAELSHGERVLDAIAQPAQMAYFARTLARRRSRAPGRVTPGRRPNWDMEHTPIDAPITKTDEEWREELTPAQYEILRKAAPSARSPAPTSTRRRRRVQVRRLRRRAVRLRHEVRLRHRLAELHRPGRRRDRRAARGRSLFMRRTEVICATAAATSGTSSPTARARAGSATASTAAR